MPVRSGQGDAMEIKFDIMECIGALYTVIVVSIAAAWTLSISGII